MSKNSLVNVITLCFLFALTAIGQTERKPLTNADIVSMLDAGLAESTIVMAIQQSTPKFDTSAGGLILLKNKSASPKILEAILIAQKAGEDTVKLIKADQEPTDAVIKLEKVKLNPKTTAREFTFEVRSCTKTSRTVTCELSIVNRSHDERILWLSRDSQIFDENGNISRATKVEFGNSTDTYRPKSPMIEKIPVNATITFSEIKKEFQTIKLLRISASSPDPNPPIRGMLSATSFSADIKDVALVQDER